MTQEEYKARFSKDDAPGWEAIDAALEKLYGAQEPQHFAQLSPQGLVEQTLLTGLVSMRAISKSRIFTL